MTYILDTDHLSFYGRNHPTVVARVSVIQEQLSTTAINVEEQLRGRLAQVAEARGGVALASAYQRLVETVLMLSEFNMLEYNARSHEVYQELKAQRIRVGTQDLRIASITLAHSGILLTRSPNCKPALIPWSRKMPGYEAQARRVIRNSTPTKNRTKPCKNESQNWKSTSTSWKQQHLLPMHY